MNPPRPLDPTHLDEHPELATLAIVRDALPVLQNALLASHPHLVGDDGQTALERHATVLLHAADVLRSAIDSYRYLVDALADDRPF